MKRITFPFILAVHTYLKFSVSADSKLFYFGIYGRDRSDDRLNGLTAAIASGSTSIMTGPANALVNLDASKAQSTLENAFKTAGAKITTKEAQDAMRSLPNDPSRFNPQMVMKVMGQAVRAKMVKDAAQAVNQDAGTFLVRYYQPTGDGTYKFGYGISY